MKIKKMTASFGTLKNQSLELQDGLNIITAPNESGKSTWCAFIRAMLYGVDSSAREKAGMKPDKLKFAPWSGGAMSGAMEVKFAGKDITLSRKGTEKAPLRELSVNYTDTAQPVQGLGTNPGETLTGVSREVFERSAFIGQGAVAVSSSAELEKRIASIVQTGEENTSCTEATEALRAGMRKRRFNTRGRIPELETEIAARREKIAEIDAQAQRGEQLRLAKQRAVENRDALTEKVAESRKEGRRQALDTLTSSRNQVRLLESETETCRERAVNAEKELISGYFGAKSYEDCAGQVNYDLNRLETLDESIGELQRQTRGKAGAVVFGLLFVIFAALAYVGLTVFAQSAFFWTGYVAAALALGFAALLFVQLARKKKLRTLLTQDEMEKQSILLKYNAASPEDISALLARHRQNVKAKAAADDAVCDAQRRLEAEKQRQAQLDDAMLKDLEFTEGDAAKYADRLKQAEEELRRVREEAAAWEGRIGLLGDRRALEAGIAELSAEKDKAQLEYDALELAVATLSEAGAEIQNRMTPALSRRSAEIFGRLTGGRYDAVTLDRELRAIAKPAEDAVGHETAFLSVGAVDQLYLAVRLAICELALDADEPCPIILDDALVNFDDERGLEALKLLKEIARARQVILFTCHSRETQLFERINP